MKNGGFNLCKWKTSDSTLQQMVDRTEGEVVVENGLVGLPEDTPLKNLGFGWNTHADYICFEFIELIQFVDSLPGPFRLISPFTMSTKVLFQQLCTHKVNWDD